MKSELQEKEVPMVGGMWHPYFDVYHESPLAKWLLWFGSLTSISARMCIEKNAATRSSTFRIQIITVFIHMLWNMNVIFLFLFSSQSLLTNKFSECEMELSLKVSYHDNICVSSITYFMAVCR